MPIRNWQTQFTFEIAYNNESTIAPFVKGVNLASPVNRRTSASAENKRLIERYDAFDCRASREIRMP
jgi:hypothetical protein